MICFHDMFHDMFVTSPDFGNRAPRMKHRPLKTQNRSRNPNTKLQQLYKLSINQPTNQHGRCVQIL
jgi:hypothetical protein